MLLIVLTWLVVATAAGLLIGGAIRVADLRDDPRDDLEREMAAVLSGLEADLRAAAAAPPPPA